ncbi:MAG TPA: twin-arginine translocation signal domain-containing protein, partial [bacterium]|nr:twin-arginine translocation signal domain-containing protein [bacterium]
PKKDQNAAEKKPGQEEKDGNPFLEKVTFLAEEFWQSFGAVFNKKFDSFIDPDTKRRGDFTKWTRDTRGRFMSFLEDAVDKEWDAKANDAKRAIIYFRTQLKEPLNRAPQDKEFLNLERTIRGANIRYKALIGEIKLSEDDLDKFMEMQDPNPLLTRDSILEDPEMRGAFISYVELLAKNAGSGRKESMERIDQIWEVLGEIATGKAFPSFMRTELSAWPQNDMQDMRGQFNSFLDNLGTELPAMHPAWEQNRDEARREWVRNPRLVRNVAEYMVLNLNQADKINQFLVEASKYAQKLPRQADQKVPEITRESIVKNAEAQRIFLQFLITKVKEQDAAQPAAPRRSELRAGEDGKKGSHRRDFLKLTGFGAAAAAVSVLPSISFSAEPPNPAKPIVIPQVLPRPGPAVVPSATIAQAPGFLPTVQRIHIGPAGEEVDDIRLLTRILANRVTKDKILDDAFLLYQAIYHPDFFRLINLRNPNSLKNLQVFPERRAFENDLKQDRRKRGLVENWGNTLIEASRTRGGWEAVSGLSRQMVSVLLIPDIKEVILEYAGKFYDRTPELERSTDLGILIGLTEAIAISYQAPQTGEVLPEPVQTEIKDKVGEMTYLAPIYMGRVPGSRELADSEIGKIYEGITGRALDYQNEEGIAWLHGEIAYLVGLIGRDLVDLPERDAWRRVPANERAAYWKSPEDAKEKNGKVDIRRKLLGSGTRPENKDEITELIQLISGDSRRRPDFARNPIDFGFLVSWGMEKHALGFDSEEGKKLLNETLLDRYKRILNDPKFAPRFAKYLGQIGMMGNLNQDLPDEEYLRILREKIRTSFPEVEKRIKGQQADPELIEEFYDLMGYVAFFARYRKEDLDKKLKDTLKTISQIRQDPEFYGTPQQMAIKMETLFKRLKFKKIG